MPTKAIFIALHHMERQCQKAQPFKMRLVPLLLFEELLRTQGESFCDPQSRYYMFREVMKQYLHQMYRKETQNTLIRHAAGRTVQEKGPMICVPNPIPGPYTYSEFAVFGHGEQFVTWTQQRIMR